MLPGKARASLPWVDVTLRKSPQWLRFFRGGVGVKFTWLPGDRADMWPGWHYGRVVTVRARVMYRWHETQLVVRETKPSDAASRSRSVAAAIRSSVARRNASLYRTYSGILKTDQTGWSSWNCSLVIAESTW